VQKHYKLGKYHRVASNLYRYSVTKKYYAVFKCHGKTKWIACLGAIKTGSVCAIKTGIMLGVYCQQAAGL
jgi:hypothetical protein